MELLQKPWRPKALSRGHAADVRENLQRDELLRGRPLLRDGLQHSGRGFAM
jgi:hypothetical protein